MRARNVRMIFILVNGSATVYGNNTTDKCTYLAHADAH